MATKKTAKSKGAGKKPVRQLELNENAKVRRHIKELKRQQNRENTMMYHIMPAVLLVCALFLALCLAVPDGMGILKYIGVLFSGLVGKVAVWLLPICMAIQAFLWKKDYIAYRITLKCVVAAVFVISVSTVHQLWLISEGAVVKPNPFDLFTMAQSLDSAGICGGLFGVLLKSIAGTVGSWIIIVLLLVVSAFAVFDITPWDMAVFVVNKIREKVYNINLERQERLEESLKEQNTAKKKLISEAKEKSEQDKAQDGLDMRKRRAFLEDAGKDSGYDDENALPPEEITPELSTDNTDISYEAQNDASERSENEEQIVDINAFDEVVNSRMQTVKDAPESEFAWAANNIPETAEGDISDIFTDDASIAIAGTQAAAGVLSGEKADLSQRKAEGAGELDSINDKVPVEPEPTVEEVYNFPPINFLKTDPNPLTFAVTDELKQTSIKLVETLKNFGVKTRIMNICCGPTVTRYELQPEVGVRVRSIANLSDDIALHLAAAGVRIEAPIPGKDAVGIEIPNKTVSTVYLRNLIESSDFENQKSKITVCLGMDVAGSPIYMNIAKMPHMLIAGATGMGKSVCINSFIVSMLYKARPDEVKLILIDPKKVELSIYNGLPHLLVPVVSDPKKAAGSLSWAVNEMERRFLLIEEVGVRDIDTYNEVTKDDPEKEYMPKIVIIIDELADLMMTARDEVETSICRLAQKARAAGMHLVIGTQRPSVDVITGLIKANVPSRIAFTVASQVDSRTIIDVSGAEKLLGRGDMLYAPVGSMKPMRVQGSFVSEKEIENIVEFLKNGKKYEYDADIIESIEREAAKCGEKKKGKGADSDGFDDAEDKDSIMNSDDAILPAIEIAVDSGSVSTSLLQRRLSLGYARAARIVDKLEKLGVVGPFEGSKPRKVLITREEYLEMRMNYEGRDE